MDLKVAGSVPNEVIFFNWPNPSSRTMALGSSQPLTEMSTRNLTGGKWLPVLKANNLTDICKPIVWTMWEPRRLTTPWGSMACYRDNSTFLTLYLVLFNKGMCRRYLVVLYKTLCRYFPYFRPYSFQFRSDQLVTRMRGMSVYYLLCDRYGRWWRHFTAWSCFVSGPVRLQTLQLEAKWPNLISWPYLAGLH
jgi:hypothetical protein